MAIRAEFMERLKALNLEPDAMAEVMAMLVELERDVETIERRRAKDREAKAAKARLLLSSNQENSSLSAESADIGRKRQEDTWRSQLQNFARGRWPYKSPSPGTTGCAIPAEFIERWKAENAA